jgi:hypothetical protein
MEFLDGETRKERTSGTAVRLEEGREFGIPVLKKAKAEFSKL